MGDRDIEIVRPPDPIMPQVMSMFPNMIPVHIPQRTWKTGLVGGYFRGRKVNQLKKEAEAEADIAEAKNRMVQANCNMVLRVFSLSSEMEAIVEEHRARRELATCSVTKSQLENQILYEKARITRMEADKAEFEYKQMLKDAGD
jgi:hypothetical protein